MVAHRVQFVHCFLAVVAPIPLRMLPWGKGAEAAQAVCGGRGRVGGGCGKVWLYHGPGHVWAHVESVQRELHHGFQLVGGLGGLSETLEMYDHDVGDGPDAQLLDDLALLVALRAEVRVLVTQTLLARVQTENKTMR